MSLLLLFRSVIGTPYGSYWGPHFPRKSRGHNSHWNRHFPDEPSTDTPGTPPTGVATFALTLESDARVTFAWRTGLFKAYSGKERRQNLVDDPAMRFEGRALLVGDDLRTVRSRIARYAALGRPFQLGLPYEEVSLSATSSGAVVNVHSTAKLDWALPGQRVVVRGRVNDAYQSIEAVIQSVTSTTITLDVTLGALGTRGATIMPTLAVYLEPQQGFQRYVTPDGVETWAVRARCAVAGFAGSDVRARLSLASPQTTGGALTGLTLLDRSSGSTGNDIEVVQTNDAATPGGELSENLGTKTVSIKFQAGATYAAQYVQLIQQNSTLLWVNGTYTGTSLLAAGDVFASTPLAGGADGAPATWGLTQTLTTFLSSPVWTKGIDVHESADDSAQSMAEVQDLGGLPFAAGSATMPDWGRRITIERARGADWQWVKKFLDTVKGRWKSFWLPTYRPDLVATAKAAGTLTVESGESDVFAWWPLQREYLAVRSTAGAWTYLYIADAVDNHDGTVTLSIEDGAGTPVTLSAVPELVCWLERCRLESDEVQVAFRDARFALSMLARAVQQDAEDAEDGTFLTDEASVERGQAREGIEISYGSVTYQLTTNTRGVVFGSDLYEASPIGRGEIRITNANDDGDETEIHLPASHPFCKRWLGGAAPPQMVTVTIRRKQVDSGVIEVVYVGEVLSVKPQGPVAVLRLVSTFARALLQRLPSITVGRTCPHVLGDENCGKNIELLKVTTTVTSYNGRSITLTSDGGHVDGWAEGGHLVHSASGESFTVFSHVGNTVEIQFPIYGLAIGDTVVLYPGCGKTITICDDTFSNAANFGNPPLLPEVNPMRATGFGVIRS